MKLKIQDNYLNHPAYSGLITQLEHKATGQQVFSHPNKDE